ncbi:hypothetical protein [Commensalibacter communis]|uniref:hypothetical protein n=1 Tax=Commensalibacter communis TaxID=2972786 RepID=UPI0023301599|nr:hypothetical protein [Commensalibacter communis]
MSNLLKAIWYFFNYLFLYFIIGIFACFLSFAFLGMIFRVPSVLIGAIALSFYRTVGQCIQGDCLSIEAIIAVP